MLKPFLILLCFIQGAIQVSVTPLLADYRENNRAFASPYETKSSVDKLRYQLNNLESEVKTFTQKIENLELILEDLREHLSQEKSEQKQLIKGNVANLELKLNKIEKNFTTDLKALQTHANETTEAFTSLKQKIDNNDQKQLLQSQNIEHLHTGLQNVLEALNIKPDPSTLSKFYIVKKGDSLEKIARSHQVSIQALREANGLSKADNKIIVGSKIKLP